MDIHTACEESYKKGYEDATPKWRLGNDTDGLSDGDRAILAVKVNSGWHVETGWFINGTWECYSGFFYQGSSVLWMPSPEVPEEAEKRILETGREKEKFGVPSDCTLTLVRDNIIYSMDYNLECLLYADTPFMRGYHRGAVRELEMIISDLGMSYQYDVESGDSHTTYSCINSIPDDLSNVSSIKITYN